jgi:hypothetical protein
MTFVQKTFSAGGTASLILAAALLALEGCSSYSAVSEYDQQQNQRKEFFAEIEKQGGSAKEQQFKKFGKEGMAWTIKIPGQVTDDMIDIMTTLGYITELDLSGSTITDEQLLKFDEKNAGRACLDLNLSNTAISDNSFANLKNFHVLQTANLKGTKVTKLGVDQFKEDYLANKEVPDLVKKGFKAEL